jgi:hypothetical protein
VLSQTISPLELGGLLAEDDRVAQRLEVAARFLAGTTCEQVLESACSEANASRLRELAPELDHLAFMARTESDDVLAAAAAHAGFDGERRSFPSTVLGRELSELLGREVPTTIFKAHGTRPDGAPMAVEVAMPQDVDAGVFQAGIGAHIALRFADYSGFGEVAQIMGREGFAVPEFMRRGPVENEAEKVQVLYFAPPARTGSLTLEFCHYS